MNKIQKMMEISKEAVDAKADIALINQYSLKELSPDDVFTFPVKLCDNEIDRDIERFSAKCLDELAPLFVGKTGIFDHSRKAENQIARLYKVVVVDGGGKNSLGEPLKVLKGYAYILRNEQTADIISKIEGGILKEVSVGTAANCKCSVCGASFPWWSMDCSKGHTKGQEYDGQLCYGSIENAKDAYEFSFVAVPAQRGAGVTKGYGAADVEKAFDVLLGADLEPYGGKFEALTDYYQKSTMDKEEKQKREKMISENQKYLAEETKQ